MAPTVAAVRLWNRTIGAVSLQDGDPLATFEYDPTFADSGIEVAPLHLRLSRDPYRFPALDRDTFHGLPGLLADSLPDDYGTALIDAWLAGQGRNPGTVKAVERLCYTGQRGTGALEFRPAKGPPSVRMNDIRIADLVELASEVLAKRTQLDTSLVTGHKQQAMREILSVGTSAGGARPKAVIAWNPTTDVIRSGQVDADPGFEHWLLKFDGVEPAGDRETLGEPQGYGALELAYSRMAGDAGTQMTPCRLLEENGRRHFMTKRFDRRGNEKVHMLSLGAMAHLDFRQARAHSYEQAFHVIRRLGMETPDVEQQFRRAVFNIVARNQDDHVKNIAFLMDKSGQWTLSPAFDVAHSYNPSGDWTSTHQMSFNGKVEGFTRADFKAAGEVAGLSKRRPLTILDEVVDVVADWPTYAAAAGVSPERTRSVKRDLRLSFPDV